MCIHPEAESPNVVTLTARRTASPWIGQTSTKAAVICPEVASWVDSSLPEPSKRERELFDSAEHNDFETCEQQRIGEMSTTDWLRTFAWLGMWFAVVLMASSLAGYAGAKGWIDLAALDQLSKWVP